MGIEPAGKKIPLRRPVVDVDRTADSINDERFSPSFAKRSRPDEVRMVAKRGEVVLWSPQSAAFAAQSSRGLLDIGEIKNRRPLLGNQIIGSHA